MFTEEDNSLMVKLPDEQEVLEVIKKSNLNAAPGTDNITNLFYFQLFNIIGKHLVSVIQEIFSRSHPTPSQHTSVMVFANKPKKMNSIQVKGKRKISLIN